jgi:hypothetical protein
LHLSFSFYFIFYVIKYEKYLIEIHTILNFISSGKNVINRKEILDRNAREFVSWCIIFMSIRKSIFRDRKKIISKLRIMLVENMFKYEFVAVYFRLWKVWGSAKIEFVAYSTYSSILTLLTAQIWVAFKWNKRIEQWWPTFFELWHKGWTSLD